MDTTTDLLEIARKTITCGERLDEFEQSEWDALSVGEQTRLQQEARADDLARAKRQMHADIHKHGEAARKHYAALSPDARQVFGVVNLLRAPTTSQPRPRGAGRPKARASSARRSSERSGDSGEGSEPPPRLCACGCELDISHRAPQARYASDAHAAYARQRRKRKRERERSNMRPGVSGRDPYLRFDLDPPKRFEDLLARVEGGCRCNGHHIADADDGHCVKCGHRRGVGAAVRCHRPR
jgi:hypothetical protein